jgi:hypothetical protein
MSRGCSSQQQRTRRRGAGSASGRARATARAGGARRRVALGAAALAFALLPAWGVSTASADEASTIIERCTHGESIAGFSRGAYAKALRELPTDVSEYSDCEELIRKAELGGGGGGIGGGSGGGLGTPGAIPPPTPAEQEILSSAAHSAPAPIRVGGAIEEPGVVPVSLASALNSLPAPLLALLAALLALALARGVPWLRRVARLRSIPLRLPFGK